MAITSTDKLIDLNRLGAFLTKLRNTFVAKVEGKDLSDNNLTDEMVEQIAKIETLIAEGGEPNKIDKVKVNGVEQTITDKAVDIKALQAKGTYQEGVLQQLELAQGGEGVTFFPTDNGIMTFLSNEGATVQEELVSKDYVDANGGKIDKIKINGTEQTITNKEVDLQVPEVSYKGDFDTVGAEGRINTKGSKSDDAIIFTKTAEGVSISASIDEGNEVVKGFQTINVYSKANADATFRTETQVSEAITAALADITGVSFQIVTELPETGENGVFYLKPITGGKSKNLYEEFVWINKGTTEAPEFVFESLGPTSVDLTGYLKDTDITLATTEDIDGLFTPATGA